MMSSLLNEIAQALHLAHSVLQPSGCRFCAFEQGALLGRYALADRVVRVTPFSVVGVDVLIPGERSALARIFPAS